MAEYIVAINVTRVRFPADAFVDQQRSSLQAKIKMKLYGVCLEILAATKYFFKAE